jgi:hypothetical protein
MKCFLRGCQQWVNVGGVFPVARWSQTIRFRRASITKQNLRTLTLTLVFVFGAGYLGAPIVQPGKDRETTDLLLADRDLLPSTFYVVWAYV